MSAPSPQNVEKYQEIIAKDPNSKVFAPLAEAYREMGMIKEAYEICLDGVKRHPSFAGGRIALARLYIDETKLEEARSQLFEATRHSPENVLAHSLLGETYLRLKQPKEALRSFKTLLFLAPDNQKAQNAVRKLESLTADEYDDEVFDMKPLSQAVAEWEEVKIEDDPEAPSGQSPIFQRLLSLADAYTVRNDHERALAALNEGERLFGAHPEVVKRLKILHQKGLDAMVVPKEAADLKPITSREDQKKSNKIHSLERLLKKFQELQKESSQ